MTDRGQYDPYTVILLHHELRDARLGVAKSSSDAIIGTATIASFLILPN